MCRVCECHGGSEKIYKEELFRALRGDDIATVKQIVLYHSPADFKLDSKIFSSSFTEHSEEKILIAYGAFSQNHKKSAMKTKWDNNSATILHVAVWSNAVRSARFLIQSGCSTGSIDSCNVPVFDRAITREMKEALERPPSPRDLQVISASDGQVVLRWSLPISHPSIECFEIREHVFEQTWVRDARRGVDHFVSGKLKSDGTLCLFRTPKGSIRSGAVHEFSIRSQNSSGFWSDWSDTLKPFVASHWTHHWETENSIYINNNKREEKESKHFDPGLKRPLIVGSKSLGLVAYDDWFTCVKREQIKASTRIQTRWRCCRDRAEFQDKQFLRKRDLLRENSAITIQHFFVHFGSRQRRERARREVLEARQSNCLPVHLKKKTIAPGFMKERERYKMLAACGFAFKNANPTIWK